MVPGTTGSSTLYNYGLIISSQAAIYTPREEEQYVFVKYLAQGGNQPLKRLSWDFSNLNPPIYKTIAILTEPKPSKVRKLDCKINLFSDLLCTHFITTL